MTQPTPAPVRHCAHCDGFPVVAITTGQLLPAGSRQTIPVACPACEGTGVADPLRQLLDSAATAVFARGRV
ncbi:hypothetical protein DMB38_18435 [Streptomyces sp. WAC 06738]|uniref:hypothetical protein n=1 Tax=Streptomyces sp. WAC 06738 TaxID=2203210 RepID=UPI000F6BBBA2|nr:hypothetical protein [Streptomyces sp. WAC 06738]AZM47506.1 hypothetical protein DMB38_18435 [Streptomyces sp. WAC 06738]